MSNCCARVGIIFWEVCVCVCSRVCVCMCVCPHTWLSTLPEGVGYVWELVWSIAERPL